MSDHLHGEPQFAALLAKAVTFAPGFAGAVMSLAFIEKLTARGRVVTVVVGFSAAYWLGPALSDMADLAWPGDMPRSVQSAIQFLVGLFAMGCIPPLLGWAKKVAGDPLSLLKVRFGGSGDSQ